MIIRLPSGRSRRLVAFAIFVLGTIWVWIFFKRPHPAFSFSHTHRSWQYYLGNSLQSPSNADTDIFDFAPIESESIRSICDETIWNPEVVFRCDESVGGIGNIRNSILNCVRYAISAGAGLVVPRIVLRNTSDISKIRTGVTTTMDYLFDTQHFIDSLHLSCPSLRLYPTVLHIPPPLNSNPNNVPVTLIPESLVEDIPKTGLDAPGEWRSLFYTWLDNYRPTELHPGPMIVALGRSYLQYPIYSDGAGFALSFGSILKLRADARRLATTTLIRLAEKYSFDLDISQPPPVLANAFYGVHLRTEKDAQEGWPAPDWLYSRYETQSKIYLEQGARSNLSIIYVGSGDQFEISKFSAEAQAVGMTVITKYDLLTGDDKIAFGKLAWDQQALVDYLVMLKASDFAGVGHSSFAWNIALKRHQFAQRANHLDGPQMLSDELSQIYGAPRGYPEYAACLWP